MVLALAPGVVGVLLNLDRWHPARWRPGRNDL